LYNIFCRTMHRKSGIGNLTSTNGTLSKEYIIWWLIWRLVTIHKFWILFDIKQLHWIFICLDEGFWTIGYHLRTAWLHMKFYNVQGVVGNMEQLIICFLCELFRNIWFQAFIWLSIFCVLPCSYLEFDLQFHRIVLCYKNYWSKP